MIISLLHLCQLFGVSSRHFYFRSHFLTLFFKFLYCVFVDCVKNMINTIDIDTESTKSNRLLSLRYTNFHYLCIYNLKFSMPFRKFILDYA